MMIIGCLRSTIKQSNVSLVKVSNAYVLFVSWVFRKVFTYSKNVDDDYNSNNDTLLNGK